MEKLKKDIYRFPLWVRVVIFTISTFLLWEAMSNIYDSNAKDSLLNFFVLWSFEIPFAVLMGLLCLYEFCVIVYRVNSKWIAKVSDKLESKYPDLL